MKTECPSDQSLREYAIGAIEDEIGEEIERHLAACPACEDSVAQFDSTEDTLMRHLPLAAANGPEVSSDPPGWLERLRNGPPAEGNADIESPDSDEASGPLADEASGPLADEASGPLADEASRPLADEASGSLADSSAYELLGVLGRGGMGIVYRARHRRLNRNVALKVLRPRLMAATEARERFEREIRILGGLHHPGIVMATDAGRIGGAAYLVMESIDGIDLARMVRLGGPLTVAEACEAARQMAEALAAAHETGTVHRDVKPSNVMVDRHGRVKLLDFGLAHLAVLSADRPETSLGRLLGTLDYMAPEQSDVDHPLDARADLFGLGATLFYLLTGRPPHGAHPGRSLLDQLRALASAEAPRVGSLRAGIPPELDDFVGRLLNRDPDERPSSAEAVAEELSNWAGGDLATRVEEVHARHGNEDVAQDDREAAQRSLSELLGVEAVAADSPVADIAQAKLSEPAPRRGWTGRTWATLTVMTAVIGAILFGVTILLKTPEGTLRIDSEVDDVRIELVDEQDRTRELQIDRGENHTTLRTGRYRVRLAGQHDGITIDREVITLLRGQETVARIARVASGPADANSKRATVQTPERLYEGKPESEWQRIFAAETDQVGKLQAAVALSTLADHLPPQAQIERILDVGEGIVRAGFGNSSIDFAFPIRALNVRSNSPSIPHDSYQQFQNRRSIAVRELPAVNLAERLCPAILQGSDSRAAYAASLLRYPAWSRIDSDPEAARIVLSQLDIPLTGMDRSAVCLLARSYYANHASDEQRRKIFSSLDELAVRTRDAPHPRNQLNNRMKDALLCAAISDGRSDWPPNLKETWASLLLDYIVDRRPDRIGVYEFLLSENETVRRPYDKASVASLRGKTRYYLDGWLSVANRYIEKHRDAPYDQAVRDIVRSLDMVLRLYSDGDEWPADKTASLLTEQLHTYYTDDTTAQSTTDILPAEPATLLTQIVRVTGRIPEFVRAGHPRAESVARRLNRFAIILSGKSDPGQLQSELNALAGLLEEAPYRATELSVGEKNLAAKTQIFVRGYYVPATRGELLYAVSSPKDDRNDRRAAPVDPLLLLAVLADLTGQSEVQDERIATILANTAPREMLRGHLEDLLSSPLKAREHARRLLREMAANAKSDSLIEAIKYLDPTLVGQESLKP